MNDFTAKIPTTPESGQMPGNTSADTSGSRTVNGAPNASDRNSLSVGPNGPLVLHDEDITHVHEEVRRAVTLLDRYRQRAHDLVYDSVSLELGGKSAAVIDRL